MNKGVVRARQSELTPHRKAVLDAVKASLDHPTARQVFQRAAKQAPQISFATVYNSLKHLSGAGLLRQIHFGDHSVRYDAILGRHDHVVCRHCGAIDDAVGTQAPPLPASFTPPAGFAIEEISMQITGMCGTCRAAAARPRGKPAQEKSPPKL